MPVLIGLDGTWVLNALTNLAQTINAGKMVTRS